MTNPSQTLPLTGQGLNKISLDKKIKKVLEMLRKRNWTIGIMESCTGGAIANAVTNIPGASDVFGVGKVTYSIKAKIEAGVDEEIIKKYGVYSIEVAEEMAKRIEGDPPLRRASVGVGVTGNLNDPAEVFVAVRIENKVESRKVSFAKASEHLDIKAKIEDRKEKKIKVVEGVVEMINDNL